MKILNVRELKTRSGDVWRRLPKEKEMVLTLNGKPIAILAAVDEASLEESLRDLRRARAVRAVSQMQRAALRAGRIPSAQAIRREIAAVRRRRTR